MPFEIDRAFYARMYGPATGDRVRLGDTRAGDVDRSKGLRRE
jgi:urease alpha subunit